MSTADDAWQPFGLEGEEAAEYAALHDGVPDWMATSFWKWVRRYFTYRASESMYSASTYEAFSDTNLHEAERVCRFTTGYSGDIPNEGMRQLKAAVIAQGLELRLADFILSKQESATSVLARELDNILHESGSAWMVASRLGRPGLVRRVDEGVQLQAEAVMFSAGVAGKRLAQAWHEAFGVNPDPSNAYSLAVRAVEDAAIPVTIPRQADATLGHVIGKLKQDGNWSLPLTREHSDAPTSSIVVRMCQALWKGHRDRHGGSQDSIPEVTQEEAETAVTLAVSLVHWFASGMVARR